jgi:acyl-coenzyme A thioesterase PaaI-like protein
MGQDGDTAGVMRRKQPNSRHCFVCGLESPVGLKLSFYAAGSGRAEAEYAVPPRYQGYPGVVHGGIVAAMLDEVAGRAVMSEDFERFMMTARLDIRYRKPVPVETKLRLSGWVDRTSGRIARAHSELRLPDGSLAAEAEAVLIDMPGGPVEPETLQALGWRVYPDQPGGAQGAPRRQEG